MRRIKAPCGAYRKLLLAEARIKIVDIQKATGINQGRLSEELHRTEGTAKNSQEHRKAIYAYYRKHSKVKPVTFVDFWSWAVVLESVY